MCKVKARAPLQVYWDFWTQPIPHIAVNSSGDPSGVTHLGCVWILERFKVHRLLCGRKFYESLGLVNNCSTSSQLWSTCTTILRQAVATAINEWNIRMGFVSPDIQYASVPHWNQSQVFLKHSAAAAMAHTAGFSSGEQGQTCRNF